jgi:hypothetical protein
MVDKLDNKAISKKYVERADAIKNSGLCCGKLIIPLSTAHLTSWANSL